MNPPFSRLISKFILIQPHSLLNGESRHVKYYHISNFLYLIASILLLIIFTKKYNRAPNYSDVIEADAETVIASVDDNF